MAEGHHRGRILLMDDEEVVREVAGEVLRGSGYDVVFAKNGEEAVNLYRKAYEGKGGVRFGLVILDLAVPGGMDGKQAMLEIRRIDPEVKAILSTGYTSDTVVSEYPIYGFMGLLCKPYSIMELRRAVQEVFGN